jgi:GxxExxY protein
VPTDGEFADDSHEVIGACIEVHRCLGAGLLESMYEECLCRELRLRGIAFDRQRRIPVLYKGFKLDGGFRIDVLVRERLIVEVKAVETLLPIHEAQVRTYLKVSGRSTALLVNFNVPVLTQGLRRLRLTPQ